MDTASGLVLAGGRSVRMGRDKALVEVGGSTLIERAVAVLVPLVADVRISTGREVRYAALGRSVCLDRFDDGGPLAGIEAGLAAAEPGLLIVLAVDMPRVTTELLGGLLARARREDLDACLLESDAGVEPLCGVYHTRLGPRIAELLERGERKVTRFLEAYPPPRVAFVHERELHFAAGAPATNLNTPADLADERRAVCLASQRDRAQRSDAQPVERRGERGDESTGDRAGVPLRKAVS